MPVEALLHGLLLPSGNDAAIALADHVAGIEPRVRRADEPRRRGMLGLRCTHFASPHGLEDGQPLVRGRPRGADADRDGEAADRAGSCARRTRPSASRSRAGKLYLNSTNPLLRMGYPGTIGLKTGYTDKAGRCFIAVVRRGGRTLGVVLLHSPNPGKQAKRFSRRLSGCVRTAQSILIQPSQSLAAAHVLAVEDAVLRPST